MNIPRPVSGIFINGDVLNQLLHIGVLLQTADKFLNIFLVLFHR